MKYFPKSQITTGLISKPGEFIINNIENIPNINPDIKNFLNNGQYIGPYFKTSSGKFYTGKEPGDPLGNYQLQPLTHSITDYQPKNIDSTQSMDVESKLIIPNKDYSYYTYKDEYKYLKNDITAPLPPPSYDFQVKNNYSTEVFRYFAQHKYTNKIIEIDKNTFESLNSSNNKIYQNELYRTIRIYWYFYEGSYEANLEQIKMGEKLGIKGFKTFFKNY